METLYNIYTVVEWAVVFGGMAFLLWYGLKLDKEEKRFSLIPVGGALQEFMRMLWTILARAPVLMAIIVVSALAAWLLLRDRIPL